MAYQSYQGSRPDPRVLDGLQVRTDDDPEVYHRPIFAAKTEKRDGYARDESLIASKDGVPPQQPRRRMSRLVVAMITGALVFVVCTAIAASVGPTVARSTCDSRIQQLSSPITAASPALATLAPSAPATNASANATCPPAAVASASQNVVIPATGCNDTSTFDSSYTSTQGETFAKACNHNYQGGDIVAATVDSWDLCMEACSVYNNYINVSNAGAARCAGIVFVPSFVVVQWAVGNHSFPGNCFLKNQVTSLSNATLNVDFEVVVAALQEAVPGS